MFKPKIYQQTYDDLIQKMLNDLSEQKKLQLPANLKFKSKHKEESLLNKYLSAYDISKSYKDPESLVMVFIIKAAIKLQPFLNWIFCQFIYSRKDSLFYGLADGIPNLLENPPITSFSAMFYAFYLVKKYYSFSIDLFATKANQVHVGNKQTQRGRTRIITRQMKEQITVSINRNSFTDFLIRLFFKANIWDLLFLDWLHSSWTVFDREEILCTLLTSLPRQLHFNFFTEPFLYFEQQQELLRESFFNGLALSMAGIMCYEKNPYSIKRSAALFFLQSLDLHYQSLYGQDQTRFSANCQYIMEFLVILFYRIILKSKKIKKQTPALKFIMDKQNNRTLYSYLNNLFKNIMNRSAYLLEYNPLLKRYWEQIKEFFPNNNWELFKNLKPKEKAWC